MYASFASYRGGGRLIQKKSRLSRSSNFVEFIQNRGGRGNLREGKARFVITTRLQSMLKSTTAVYIPRRAAMHSYMVLSFYRRLEIAALAKKSRAIFWWENGQFTSTTALNEKLQETLM